MAEEKVVEQKQEHVSENPEIKDTEHVESSEVPPEAMSEGIVVDPATKEENEITPHEKSVEEVTAEANKLMQLQKKQMGDENSSVYIDMSKIVMDKDGIPEFTHDDAVKLRDSDIVLSDFEYEIRESRNIIKAIRNELDEKGQEIREKNCKEQIEKIDARLKEIEALKEEELTDEIKKEKSDIETAKSIFATEITDLPKYNEKIKNELLRREANAKKHIATYQNIARHDLGQLQNDGTIVGLVSSTANAAFAQAFVDTSEKAKGNPTLDENKEINEIKNKNKFSDQSYQMANLLHESLENVDSGNIEYLVNFLNKDFEKEYDKETYEKLNLKRIDEVPDLINKISSPSVSPAEQDTLYNKYLEIRNDISISLEDPENESENIKKARAEATLFFERFETFSKGKISINQYYQFIAEKPLEKFIPEVTKDTNVEEIKGMIEEIRPVINKKYDEEFKKSTEIEDKIEEIRDKIIKPYKTYLRKNGIFNSFITYAFVGSDNRGYYARPESALEYQHIKTMANAFNNVIKINMKDDSDEEYSKLKINVNSVSMFFNNIIRYFIDIYDNNIDIEWASNFDSESILKNFYYENKEKIDPFIEEYKNTIKVFSHLICHNIKFGNVYEKLISEIIDDIASKDYKLKKIDENKRVKNKHEFTTDIAFEYQFVTSYKKFNDAIKKVNDAVEEKRKNEPEIKFEDFDKWYKETQLEDELAATKPVVSSFLHLLVGCSVIYAFYNFDTYFANKNNNKNLRRDCMNYFFNEYILESFAFKNCPKDKTYEDYIRDRSKTVAFQSLDYSFQRDVDIDESRLQTISYIFGYATNCFKVLFDNVCGEKKIEKKEDKKETKKDKQKKAAKTREELIKSYKAKSKEKKKNLNSFKTAMKDYDQILNHITYDSSITKFTDNDSIYDVRVYPSKDTKVIVRVERYAKKIYDEDVKKIFEAATIIKDTPVNVKEAFVAARNVTNENLTNINEKWYYNQYVDGSIAKRDGKDLSTIDKSTFTLSERCRNTINICLKNSYEKIIKEAINIIKHTGVEFEGKTIAVKNNCKFDIKYFKSNNPSNSYGGNLNFFKAGIWDIITFELNYDIVNEKK